MKAKTYFRVVQFKNAGGTTSYRVTGSLNHKQVRKNYSNEIEAEAERVRLETERANQISELRIIHTRLTSAQAAEAERAFDVLKGHSLDAAVKFFLNNYRKPVREMLLSAALDEYVKSMTSSCRPASIGDVKDRVGLLARCYPKKHVHEVTAEDLKLVIFKPGLAPLTSLNYRRVYSGFFNWAKLQTFCAANPIDVVPKIKVDSKRPGVLEIAEVRRLLAAASSYRNGLLLPYVALGVFAGLRPTELSRLTWSAIDLESGEIEIGDTIAKMRRYRIVAMQPNLIKFLTPFAVEKPPLVGLNFRNHFDAVKRLAGFGTQKVEKTQKSKIEAENVEALPLGKPTLKRWIPDVMRHTAITFFYGLCQDEGKAAIWAGNSPNVIHKHYKKPAKAATVKEFWSIEPERENIVALKLA